MTGTTVAVDIALLRFAANRLRFNHYGDFMPHWTIMVCKNTFVHDRFTHGLWIRWKTGGTHAFELAKHSFDYLQSIQGTGLERGVVTLWTVKNDLLVIDLGDTSVYQVYRKVKESDPNPLNHPHHYDNPLS